MSDPGGKRWSEKVLDFDFELENVLSKTLPAWIKSLCTRTY
jgi:hypothetical protein